MSVRLLSSRRLICVTALAAGALGGPALRAQSAPPDTASVVLHSGDAIRISVWRQPDFSGEFTIGPDGFITHPLYRSVAVAGLPLPQIEARLRTFLEQYESHPQFVVEPLLRVAVGGEVARPNLYLLRPGTSVAQAVAMAGGPTERGRWDRVRLFRGSAIAQVNLISSNPGEAQQPVRSGDQILVERRRAVFRDYLGPLITVAGATAAILNVILRADNR